MNILRVYSPEMREGIPGRIEERKVSKVTRIAGWAGYLFLLYMILMLGFQIGKYVFGG